MEAEHIPPDSRGVRSPTPMTTPETPDRPLRSDAERNRRRILQAAADVFAERGLDASLDDIAAAAGVGVGTVYRRFPDKDALIDALFEDKIGEVEQAALAALQIEDPWDSFATFMRSVCRMQAEDRGLKEALLARDRGRERVAHARERIAPVATRILRRAQDAGVVRADLGPFDVPMMHFAVGFVAERTREAAPGYWERLLAILLDGVAAGAARTAMPSPPLDQDQFVGAMTCRRP
jgi:AcrR family transcriptional regulator